mgnify:CR=1 FL=1
MKTQRSKGDRPIGRVKGETTSPVVVLQLMETLGPARAARAMGISPTTLYKAQKTGVVSKNIELAAEAVMNQGGVPKAAHAPQPTAPQPVVARNGGAHSATTAVVVIEVPTTKVELLKRVAQQFGGFVVE